MNIIISYLDTMFSAYPETPRLAEAKAELQGMMEDAYTNLIAEGRSENEAVGQVIRDFGNLSEVAPELGIATEIAPVTAASFAQAGSGSAPAQPLHPPVTMTEARGYADAKQRVRFRVALAVALFVLSPIAIVTLPAAERIGALPFSSGIATLIGLLVLFACVAAGVMTLVSTSQEFATLRRIADGKFSPDPVVSAWATELAQQHERGRVRALRFAVPLWILSPLPLITFSLLRDDLPRENLWVVSGVAILLLIVATGLFILLPTTWAQSAAEHLTGAEAESAVLDAEKNGIVGVVASFYWPLLTAIYLAWSFIGNAWGHSWIIWPVGGVLFGAIAAGTGALESYRKNRR